MTPNVASQVVLLQGNNPDLGFRFFKWVCKQSTYCYDIGGRVHLLNLVVSSNLFGVAHKAIVELIKECSENEDDILKLMDALDGLRKDGFKLNYPCYSGLLMSLAKLNLGFVAYIVYRRMVLDGFVIGAIDYRTIINALCKCGLVQAAEMFLCRVLKLGFSLGTHICTSFVLGHCRENNLQEAFKVFEIMSKEDGCRPNSVTFSTLIHGLCEVGRLEEAFSLKEEMSEKGCQPTMHLLHRVVDNGLFPDKVAYNILVDGFCREGQLDMALKIFNSMSSVGLIPDGYTFTSMINGLCKQGRTELATGFFGLMIKKGISFDEVAITALIDGLCKSGKTGDALMIFERMVEIMVLKSSHVLNLFLDVFSKENKLKEEYAMFGKILKYGVVPSVVTYTILIDGLSRAGEFSLALNMIKMMNLAGCPPNVYTYTVIINGLCQSGRLNEAQMLTFKMFDFGVSPNHITYTILVKAHVNAGRLDHALNIVSIMAVNGCQLNDRIFSALIKGLISSNKAIEVQSDGSSSHVDARPLRLEYNDDVDDKCVSNNVIREMDIEHARRLGDKIARFGGSITDLYNFLAAELCRAGRIAEADSITKDIVQLGSFPDIAISFIIEWYCKEGKVFIMREGVKKAERLVSDLLRFSGIEEKTVVLPYIDFLLKGDKSDKCLDLQNLIDQMHYRGRPVI
ncbi:hypothetical protein Patl1_01532 [Pistacia atlantica]|uniref:Uncharacterized protein n=1 Tax=Pistacia atlantica TaxID=434234 RepID=A0ACC1CAF0_9ROSI|nr:hypothetical protein Patl1_01532 [Pistacia atlantica]